jgi:hypothetical protein
VTSAKLRQALELMRNLMKKYDSDEELHRRFREGLVRDPVIKTVRRDIFIDLLEL